MSKNPKKVKNRQKKSLGWPDFLGSVGKPQPDNFFFGLIYHHNHNIIIYLVLRGWVEGFTHKKKYFEKKRKKK